MTGKRKTKRSTSSTKEEGKTKESTWHILKDKTQHKYVQYCRELFESLDTESLDYLSSWKDLMIYKSEDSPIVTLFSKYDAHLQAFKLFLIIARITELQDNKEEPFQHGRTGFGAAQPLYNQHRLCFTLILANMYKEQVKMAIRNQNESSAVSEGVYPKDIQNQETKSNLDSKVLATFQNDDLMNGKTKVQSYNIYDKYYTEDARLFSTKTHNDHAIHASKYYNIYPAKIQSRARSKSRNKRQKIEHSSISRRETRSSTSSYTMMQSLHHTIRSGKSNSVQYTKLLETFTPLELTHLAHFAESYIVPFRVHSLRPEVIELMRSSLSCLASAVDIDLQDSRTESASSGLDLSFEEYDLVKCATTLESIFSRIEDLHEERSGRTEGSRQWQTIIDLILQSEARVLNTVLDTDDLETTTPTGSSSSSKSSAGTSEAKLSKNEASESSAVKENNKADDQNIDDDDIDTYIDIDGDEDNQEKIDNDEDDLSEDNDD